MLLIPQEIVVFLLSGDFCSSRETRISRVNNYRPFYDRWYLARIPVIKEQNELTSLFKEIQCFVVSTLFLNTTVFLLRML